MSIAEFHCSLFVSTRLCPLPIPQNDDCVSPYHQKNYILASKLDASTRIFCTIYPVYMQHFNSVPPVTSMIWSFHFNVLTTLLQHCVSLSKVYQLLLKFSSYSKVCSTLCMLCNFACILSSVDFLFNFFKNNLSGIPSKCQTVWIQISHFISTAMSSLTTLLQHCVSLSKVYQLLLKFSSHSKVFSTLCMLGNFACILSSVDFLINFFKNNLSGIPSKCQTVWIQIRPDVVGPNLGPNCLQRLSAATKVATSGERFKN